MKHLALTLSLILGNYITQSEAANWSSTSVAYQTGTNFESGNTHRDELSYEHASGWDYGDNYFWMDVTNGYRGQAGDSNMELYGEFSPRLSLGKIFGGYNKDRLVQDVLIATTFEHGRSAFGPNRSLLYGLGLDLKLPHFAFFQWNFYIRDNIDKTGTTLQSTFAYKVPFTFSEKFKFAYEAYLDIVHGDEGTESDSTLTESHFHTGQQLYVDVLNFWNKPGVLMAGIEYQYWNRKFGTKGGPVENNLKWLIKWYL